jgi:hypothetical protein
LLAPFEELQPKTKVLAHSELRSAERLEFLHLLQRFGLFGGDARSGSGTRNIRRGTMQSGWLFLRKFFFEFTGELVYICCLTKRLNLLLGGIHVHAHMLAEFL